MKRNKFGMSHKVKGSMDFGLRYPVLVQEMIPGDILRVKPEAIVKAVIPPVTSLTDKVYWKMEAYQVADRLLDDHFVANLSTTKTGQVKGDFKQWTLDQIERNFGSKSKGYSSPLRGNVIKYPVAWRNRSVTGVAEPVASGSTNDRVNSITFSADNPVIDGVPQTNFYSECLPVAIKNDKRSGHETYYRCSPYFGQGSLLDWLGLEPNGNLGNANGASFRTNAISAYYMINNFYNTNPEYEKYIAPYFDYVYSGRDNSENRETLHRYETLEEEFGNGFEEPHLCGRCVNGLVVDNWSNDYFSKTTIDPQRGIAPTVPVSLTGSLPVGMFRNNSPHAADGVAFGSYGEIYSNYHGGSPDSQAFASAEVNVNPNFNSKMDVMSGSFTISDLRTALALQHFQEDIQGTYKWTSFLQRVFGISPSDTLADQPILKGSCHGTLASSEVLQTVQTDTGNLGDIGGHLSGYGTGKTIVAKASEHSVFMIIMTIKVERNYESGVERQFTRKNYLDMYFPQFVGIGNQAIRADELLSCWSNADRAKNIAFTSRYEEMRHKYNRIVGKCRNDNMLCRTVNAENSYGVSTPYTLGEMRESGVYDVPYLNDFHPYAIGDSYSTGLAVNSLTGYSKKAIIFNEINQDFLLCIPQLNDIFVDDTEEPFLVVIGFNMDMFRPLPVYTKPGIQYV